jgi:hypothetical protein
MMRGMMLSGVMARGYSLCGQLDVCVSQWI